MRDTGSQDSGSIVWLGFWYVLHHPQRSMRRFDCVQYMYIILFTVHCILLMTAVCLLCDTPDRLLSDERWACIYELQ